MAGPGTLPTAAAVAAAAVTAKITAMDAQEQIKSLVGLGAKCPVMEINQNDRKKILDVYIIIFIFELIDFTFL